MASRTISSLVEGEDASAVSANAQQIMTKWLGQFATALAARDPAKVGELFVVDGWLKDDLVFSWDTRTVNGVPNIVRYIVQDGCKLHHLSVSKNPHFQPALKTAPMVWIESGIDFTTENGRGRGIVRLANTAGGEWKAWILFVALEELKCHPRRSLKDGHRNLEQQKLPSALSAISPAVIIIGGGSTGLAVAACLQDLGVKTLIVERSKHIGDVWRDRYKRLELHSPSYGDARPFLDVPTNWPTFPHKNQYGDYLESYARVMDLNIWTNTEFKEAHYDDEAATWTVKTSTGGVANKLVHPRHVIWAGGAFVNDKPILPTFLGSAEFKGQIYHAGTHQDAAAISNVQGKKVVVIGSKTSAHDICQDFAEAGADVTMIQRSSTLVLSPESTVQLAMPPPAPGQSNTDYIFHLRSFPTFVLFSIMEQLTPLMLELDREIIEGLEQTEFVVSKGEDGDTFFRRGVLTRGGFYVNHGASELIASKVIKVMYCPGGVKRLTEDGLVLADDRAVDADIIVLATGWHQIEQVLGNVMGEAVANRANKVNNASAIDEEGQPPGIFRPTGHPGFWVAAGNLVGTSMNSLLLALQIKAKEVGLS